MPAPFQERGIEAYIFSHIPFAREIPLDHFSPFPPHTPRCFRILKHLQDRFRRLRIVRLHKIAIAPFSITSPLPHLSNDGLPMAIASTNTPPCASESGKTKISMDSEIWDIPSHSEQEHIPDNLIVLLYQKHSSSVAVTYKDKRRMRDPIQY